MPDTATAKKKKGGLKWRDLAALYVSNASARLRIDVDIARNKTTAQCQRWHIYNETK